ncbi:uncharacterized protein LOC134269726 [Saccostrea cucullata]|uniref:uncharacterized protein LOC134269726 n=2 Tax=Saccostrea cuccullata TaxID=36930 RepID=UPI002ED0406F
MNDTKELVKTEKRRFASIDDEGIKNLMENVEAQNTKRVTSTSVKLFREYLLTKGQELDFESFDNEKLDELLSKFYLEMRNRDGEMYKKTTLLSYRQGLQRHLEKTRTDIDILKGTDFKKSARAFKCMTKELKRQGRAAIDHHPPISDEHLEVIYEHLTQNLEDAKMLQYKVFLDIMLHFGRRGRENLSSLTRKDFAVMRGEGNQLFVYKTKDEKTKNHQDDSEKSSDGRMYEIKDSDRCPVRSFVKYLRRLSPHCPRLFQQPRSVPKDNTYYCNIPVGHNELGQYMKRICVSAGINVLYTNHSCRATTVSVLDSANIPSRHIMSVTGHKAESSLKTYSGKTNENTKKVMSQIISGKISGRKATETVTSPSPMQDYSLLPLSNSQEEVLMKDLFDESDGIDDILRSIEFEQNVQVQKTQVNTTLVQPPTLQSANMLVPIPGLSLTNCTSVTINYNIMQKH